MSLHRADVQPCHPGEAFGSGIRVAQRVEVHELREGDRRETRGRGHVAFRRKDCGNPGVSRPLRVLHHARALRGRRSIDPGDGAAWRGGGLGGGGHRAFTLARLSMAPCTDMGRGVTRHGLATNVDRVAVRWRATDVEAAVHHAESLDRVGIARGVPPFVACDARAPPEESMTMLAKDKFDHGLPAVEDLSKFVELGGVSLKFRDCGSDQPGEVCRFRFDRPVGGAVFDHRLVEIVNIFEVAEANGADPGEPAGVVGVPAAGGVERFGGELPSPKSNRRSSPSSAVQCARKRGRACRPSATQANRSKRQVSPPRRRRVRGLTRGSRGSSIASEITAVMPVAQRYPIEQRATRRTRKRDDHASAYGANSSADVWKYRLSVVVMFACPNNIDTAWIGTPCVSIRVALVCRQQWNPR